jgi:hypothetical protein
VVEVVVVCIVIITVIVDEGGGFRNEGFAVMSRETILILVRLCHDVFTDVMMEITVDASTVRVGPVNFDTSDSPQCVRVIVREDRATFGRGEFLKHSSIVSVVMIQSEPGQERRTRASQDQAFETGDFPVYVTSVLLVLSLRDFQSAWVGVDKIR